MATLDASIVNIALPTLTREFDTEITRIKWVVISYLLSLICLTLPFGRLSDYLGRRRVFISGYVVFTLGSLLCGISPTLPALLGARALQGVGASMLMSNGPAIITSAFPVGKRGAALGVLSMIVSLGLLSGPSLGGLLLAHARWNVLFLINIPIGLLGIFLAYRFIPSHTRPESLGPSFDWLGVGLQAALLLTFIAAVESPQIAFPGMGSLPIPRFVIGAVSFLLFIFLIRVELKAQSPILDLSLFKIPLFRLANLASFFCFVSFSSAMILMPFFLEGVLGLTSDQTGILLTANPIAVLVTAPISGKLSDRIGSTGLSAVGALLGTVAIAALAGMFGAGLNASISKTQILVALACMGAATGIFQSPNNNSIMSAVPGEKLSSASALLATVRNMGMVTGTGVATGLLAWRYELTMDHIESFHYVLYVAALFGLGAFLSCLLKIKKNGLET